MSFHMSQLLWHLWLKQCHENHHNINSLNISEPIYKPAIVCSNKKSSGNLCTLVKLNFAVFCINMSNPSQPEVPSLLVCIAPTSVALLAQPAAAQFSYPARVQQADSCPSNEQREATRSDINSDLDAMLQDFVIPPLIDAMWGVGVETNCLCQHNWK